MITTTTTTTTTYAAEGGVRGCCGHHHRTISAAHLCAERDARRCYKLGGGSYSDRRVVAWSEESAFGLTRLLTVSERDDLDAIEWSAV
jgi:hypothetical protein